jgi:single-stranded-DNA-specific exonuclease
MVRTGKKWRVLPYQSDLSRKLGQEVGVSPIVAQVLINRGICDAAAAEIFLRGGDEGMGDPCLLKGMNEAVGRINLAVAEQEKITIYGDYDVDGITATALLYRVLKQLNAVVEYYIPERQSEGYGLNAAALEALHLSGTRLIITVDCGINAVTEVANMAQRLDVIITDHHQPPDILPAAFAVINPKQPGCLYPEKQLAGVGVAFKLCQALWQSSVPAGKRFVDYLDLVATGTIADIVPLTDENRLLVKRGLSQLTKTANLGLQALIKVSGLSADKIDAGKVGYILAPRLNAAGRLSHASAGVELLVTADPVRASELAAELNNENIKRQAVEKELLAAAEDILATSDQGQGKVLVLAGEDWHPGVIGIVASRLVDKYYRPTVMISIRDGIGKGSCRSIPGFDIYQALSSCSDLLIQFGGHRQAAGLSLDAANIDSFRDRLNTLAAECLSDDDYLPSLSIDSEVALAEINAGFIEQLSCLAPHGMGNPSPVFACDDLAVTDMRPLGADGRHYRLRVKQDNAVSEVLAWNLAGMTEDLEANDNIDLAFVPEFNDWQGRRSIQLRARDLRPRQTLPDRLVLTDSRNTADKAAYIRDLAANGGQVLVYTTDRRQAVTLARQLRRPPHSLSAALYHTQLAPGAGKRTLDGWQAGNSAILVSAGLQTAHAGAAAHAVWYQPPLTREEFAGQCLSLADDSHSVNLHFLYGSEDILEAVEQLVAVFPDRLTVGRVYLTLKGLTASGALTISDSTLARKTVQANGLPLSEAGVAAALRILEELDLLNLGGVPGRRILYLKPDPAQKKNIERSNTYRECARVRDSFTRWSRDLMKLSVTALWKMTVHPC